MQKANEETVLITGASSGIGAALAEEFASHGHDVVLLARSEGRLEQIGGRLRQQYGVEAHIIARDLSLSESAREVLDELRARSIQIDVLVNNAGMIVYGEFSETDLQAELQMIGVNLLATTELTKLFLPVMIQNGYGRILNLGSNGSFAPSPLNAVYSATKAYVLSFSEAIAEELASTGVTVTALCPGATESDLQRRAGMDDVRLLQRGVMSAKAVAEAGYAGLMAGERVVVPGLMNKLQIFLLRFLPRRMVVKLAQAMLQRTS
jgi:short-subunit dehydrogenase